MDLYFKKAFITLQLPQNQMETLRIEMRQITLAVCLVCAQSFHRITDEKGCCKFVKSHVLISSLMHSNVILKMAHVKHCKA